MAALRPTKRREVADTGTKQHGVVEALKESWEAVSFRLQQVGVGLVTADAASLRIDHSFFTSLILDMCFASATFLGSRGLSAGANSRLRTSPQCKMNH
jgi:hypothetical protein